MTRPVNLNLQCKTNTIKKLVIGQKTEFAHQALNWNRWTKSWYTTGYNTTPYKLGTFRSQTDPLHYGPHSAHLTDFGRAAVSSGLPSEISSPADPRKCWKHEVERGSGGTCQGRRLPGMEADRLRCWSSDHRWPPISQQSHRKSCFVRRYSIICSSYLLRFSTARNHTQQNTKSIKIDIAPLKDPDSKALCCNNGCNS